METNAPEKLYITNDENRFSDKCHSASTEKYVDNDIEYTRTDAFIEKALKWIEEINNHHHIMRYSDSCEPPLSELTEWFKNYMKGE